MTALEIDEGLLDAFIGDGSISDVLYVFAAGKATVYCCRGAGGELVAAKVYVRSSGAISQRSIYRPGATGC